MRNLRSLLPEAMLCSVFPPRNSQLPRTGELSKGAIACRSNQPPLAAEEARSDHFPLELLEMSVGSLLRVLHERRVSDYIGRQYCGQAPVDLLLGPAVSSEVLPALGHQITS